LKNLKFRYAVLSEKSMKRKLLRRQLASDANSGPHREGVGGREGDVEVTEEGRGGEGRGGEGRRETAGANSGPHGEGVGGREGDSGLRQMTEKGRGGDGSGGEGRGGEEKRGRNLEREIAVAQVCVCVYVCVCVCVYVCVGKTL
jgi:hypothetical protein